jgi:hypothetical protein
MQMPAIAERVFAIVSPDDFAVPAHAHLAASCTAAMLAGAAAPGRDPHRRPGRRGRSARSAAATTCSSCAARRGPHSAPLLAEDIRRCSVRAASSRSAPGSSSGPNVRRLRTARRHHRRPGAARRRRRGRTGHREHHRPDPDRLPAGDDDPEDWVIPGLLAREDRLILTGAEGLGKMMLLRQIAVCAAAGLDPFTTSRSSRRPCCWSTWRTRRRSCARPSAAWSSRPSKSARHDVTDRVFVERRPEGSTSPSPRTWRG